MPLTECNLRRGELCIELVNSLATIKLAGRNQKRELAELIEAAQFVSQSIFPITLLLTTP